MEEIKTDNNEDYDVISLRDLQMYDHTPTSSTHSSPRISNSSAQTLFEFFPILSNGDPIRTGDIVFAGSSSFRLPDRPIEHAVPVRSVSDREIGFGSVPDRRAVKLSSSVKKVNITALTAMSSKSRRRMFMFGPVKFKPEMEMKEIKERQGRRAPSRMFPVVVAAGGESEKVVVGGDRCRSRLNSVFERSLACLRPSGIY